MCITADLQIQRGTGSHPSCPAQFRSPRSSLHWQTCNVCKLVGFWNVDLPPPPPPHTPHTHLHTRIIMSTKTSWRFACESGIVRITGPHSIQTDYMRTGLPFMPMSPTWGQACHLCQCLPHHYRVSTYLFQNIVLKTYIGIPLCQHPTGYRGSMWTGTQCG